MSDTAISPEGVPEGFRRGVTTDRGRSSSLPVAMVAVVAIVAAVLPFPSTDLGGRPAFVPAVLALGGALDLLSALLLVHQFRDFGDRRALALASSYVFSLVLGGYGAAFPGVLADVGPLGAWASTAPWLWVA